MKKFENILAQCIEDIKAGRSSIEDCLDRYPSVRGQLEPLLKIALEIREPSDIKPSATFKVKARVQLMDRIHGRQAARKWPWSRYDNQMKPIPYIKKLSMSTGGVIVAIVLTLSGLGVGTVYASQASLPGDTLYPVKLGTEQVVMTLSGDDVARAERALSFADRRVREMEVLAERERLQDLGLAAEEYAYALNTTLTTLERARNKGLAAENMTALVAEAAARHLLILDEVWDMVPEEARSAVAHAINVSEMGRENALAALARNNTVWATELNLAAMEGRLNRIRARVQNREAVQVALQQFETMTGFDEEIPRIAQEIGLNATEVEELIAQATCMHLQVLAEIWEQVPEQTKPAIESVMANLQIRNQERIRALEQKGIQSPPPPVIPERLQQSIEERIREREQQGAPDGATSPGQDILGAVGQQSGHGAT